MRPGATHFDESRLTMVAALFFIMALVLIYRLFDLQVLKHKIYSAQASKIHMVEKELHPLRGKIFVRDDDGSLFPIVSNRDYYLVFSDPREIEDRKEFIDTITPILDLQEEEWKDLLSRIAKKDDPYEPIKKKVPREKIERLEASQLQGVYYVSESYRMYPEKNIGGHILGFVDYNGIGRYGIEGYFHDVLTGQEGILKSSQDATGLMITVGEREVKRPIHGSDIVLTIKRGIQLTACEEIKKGVEFFEAEGGTVIVMNPHTGFILAMCSFPDFDPERYNAVEDITIFNNPAIFYAYEPGSIFKAITMAIGLDRGVITPQTTYEDTGEVKLIGHKPIRNADLQAHGVQTMTQVLEKSLNTGAVFVVDRIGKEAFRTYVQNFGFGKKTGITLDTEVSGNISSLDKPGQIYSLTASFGQGITVTPLQFITAFSALVNGGRLMRPTIVEEIIQSNGSSQKIQPELVRQVVSSRTSALITGMLVSVVENGWAKKAKVEGYMVGGKTGTAQIVGEDGRYGEDTIHSFVGFAPADNPSFVILVKLDKPKALRFASDTATVVFRRIAEFILHNKQLIPQE